MDGESVSNDGASVSDTAVVATESSTGQAQEGSGFAFNAAQDSQAANVALGITFSPAPVADSSTGKNAINAVMGLLAFTPIGPAISLGKAAFSAASTLGSIAGNGAASASVDLGEIGASNGDYTTRVVDRIVLPQRALPVSLAANSPIETAVTGAQSAASIGASAGNVSGVATLKQTDAATVSIWTLIVGALGVASIFAGA